MRRQKTMTRHAQKMRRPFECYTHRTVCRKTSTVGTGTRSASTRSAPGPSITLGKFGGVPSAATRRTSALRLKTAQGTLRSYNRQTYCKVTAPQHFLQSIRQQCNKRPADYPTDRLLRGSHVKTSRGEDPETKKCETQHECPARQGQPESLPKLPSDHYVEKSRANKHSAAMANLAKPSDRAVAA
jgi:hypothetical protein